MSDADPSAADENDRSETEAEFESSAFEDTEFDSSEFDDTEEIAPSGSVSKFRRTSAGAILNGVALGLRDVFEVEKEQAPIVQEAAGEPERKRQVDANLDEDDPTQSSVTVRPWLFEDRSDA